MSDFVIPEKEGKLVLVTGATGFIGRALTAMLIARGYRVRALLRKESNQGDSFQEQVEIHRSDLDNEVGLAQACNNVAVVFHLAGRAHAGTVDSRELLQVNVEGTRALADACKKSGVKRFVYFSSVLAAALDEGAGNASQASGYARSKKSAEELLLAGANDDFQPTILRPVNVYGSGMKGNIAAMVRRIKAGSLPPLPRLSNSLALISVEDLCQAAIVTAESAASKCQIYTVCDGEVYTPNSLEHAIYGALGRKKPGWRTPRMVFYAASLGAQIANNLGIWNNDMGLRTYRNLIGGDGAGQASQQQKICEKISTELGFKPSQTFYDVLPEIIENLDEAAS